MTDQDRARDAMIALNTTCEKDCEECLGILERALAAARAEEREACARVCDKYSRNCIARGGRSEDRGQGAAHCAAAIRARGEPPEGS